MSLPSAHSPLGGSAAYRFIACPGSANMSRGIEDGESEHAALGTAAHELAALCIKTGMDTWQHIGNTIAGHEVDANMADAVQEYVQAIRDKHNVCNGMIEFPFHAEGIHPLMYGTSDFVCPGNDGETLHVWDYKHGVGVVVGVKDNPQTMYYAAGVLEVLQGWRKYKRVVAYIAQPRGFHPDGAIRSFSYSVEEIRKWTDEVLVSAMDAAETSIDTFAGDHCRFCPARGHGCPAMLENIEELAKLTKLMDDVGGAPALTLEQMGRILTLSTIADIQRKAVREVAFARLSKEQKVPGWKLVQGKSNRAWKEGVFGPAFEEFGSLAFAAPFEGLAQAFAALEGEDNLKPFLHEGTMKSVAQMEKVPNGKEFVARWAFKPPAGRTIAPETDLRRGLSSDVKKLFTKVST